MRSVGNPVTGPILIEKAKPFYNESNYLEHILWGQ